MIHRVHGNLAYPKQEGICVIAHPVSVMGVWYGEPSRRIAKRWDQPSDHFRPFTRWRKKELKLGMNLWNCVGIKCFDEQHIFVVSMVARSAELELKALEKCLQDTLEGTQYLCGDGHFDPKERATFHLPYMGDEAEKMAGDIMRDFEVYIYQEEAIWKTDKS